MSITSVRNYLTILALSSAISACSWDSLLVKTEPVEKLPLVVAQPKPVVTLPVNWIVITQENVAQVLAEQKKLGNAVFLAVTPDGYKNIASNQAEILRYIIQQQAVIAAYKDYYVTPEKPAAK